MPIESQNDPSATTYAVAIFVAFCGAFMRAGRWRDEKTGKLLWSRFATEVPISVAFGYLAIGIGSYYQVPAPVYGGIAGLLGLLGPAGVEAFLSIIKFRFGGTGGKG